MNLKKTFASWFWLGVLIYLLQIPFQYILFMLGLKAMYGLAIGLSALTASMLFTYYVYPRIMSPAFKIYAILTTFGLSFIAATIIIMSNNELKEGFRQILQNTFAQSPGKSAVVMGLVTAIGFLLQFAACYLFTALGNKQMVNAMEREAKK